MSRSDARFPAVGVRRTPSAERQERSRAKRREQGGGLVSAMISSAALRALDEIVNRCACTKTMAIEQALLNESIRLADPEGKP